MIMFQTLSRYIARRYLVTFIINFLSVVLLIFMIDFSENARRFSDLESYSVGVSIQLSLLHVPGLIQISVPFIVLVASISTLLGLNRKYELVIARASGLSAWQFLAPILLCNFIIGILSVTALNPLSAASSAYASQLSAEAGFGETLNSDENNAPWLRQTTDEGTTIIGGRSSANDGRLLREVTLLILNEQMEINARIEAHSASLKDDYWLIEGGRKFQDGEIVDLPENYKVKTNLKPEFVQERFASADSVSFFQLPGKIAAANSFGLKANVYQMKLHQLIALPAFLIGMTLVAAMVSLTFVRFGQSLYAIIGGILFGFLLYVLSELITAFGEVGSIPPVVAAWLPVLVATTIGTTVLLHKEDG